MSLWCRGMAEIIETFMFSRNQRMQMRSIAMVASTLYLASVHNKVIVDCFLTQHEIGAEPMNAQMPIVDL